MTLPTSPRSRALTLLAGVIVGLCGLFLFPAGAASAHAALISTNPVAGSVVPTAPAEIVITFSEHVTPVPAKISVIGPGEKRIENGAPTSVGDQLRIPVKADVPEGTYLVSYRVISADSHPVGSGFYYSVVAKSAGGVPKPLTSDSTDPVVATAVSVAQFVGFAGLCLVVGPALVLVALWPRRLDRTMPTRLAYWGLGATAVATVAGLYLQAPYGTGQSLFGVSGSDISDVFDTHFGEALLVRLAILVVASFLLRPVLAGQGSQTDHTLLVILGAIGVGTWAFAGHPASSSVPPLTIIADVAHLISVAVWLGGLVMLAGFLLRRANARELRAILPVWSNWATLAVTVLVLGGTAQALIQIGSFDSLFHTTYGQLVIVKVAILAVILLFANGARRMVQRSALESATAEAEPVEVDAVVAAGTGGRGGGSTPTEMAPIEPGRSGRDGGGGGDDSEPGESTGWAEPRIKRLRRSVLVELGLAVAVLIATSILVQSSPARDAAAVSSGNDPGTVSLTCPLYTLQVDFLPSNGATDIHMFAFNAAGGPQVVQAWTVVATLPSQNLTEKLGVSVITQTHAVSEAILPVGGKWTFTFTLQTSPIDEQSVSTTVNIG